MKYNSNITKSRRKNRKRHFLSSSQEKRKNMISPLSKKLSLQFHNIKSAPIRKEDEVQIVRGLYRGEFGKVVQCQRKNFKILIDKLIRMKSNKTSAFIPISPSNVIITKLFLNPDRNMFFGNKKHSRCFPV